MGDMGRLHFTATHEEPDNPFLQLGDPRGSGGT